MPSRIIETPSGPVRVPYDPRTARRAVTPCPTTGCPAPRAATARTRCPVAASGRVRRVHQPVGVAPDTGGRGRRPTWPAPVVERLGRTALVRPLPGSYPSGSFPATCGTPSSPGFPAGGPRLSARLPGQAGPRRRRASQPGGRTVVARLPSGWATIVSGLPLQRAARCAAVVRRPVGIAPGIRQRAVREPFGAARSRIACGTPFEPVGPAADPAPDQRQPAPPHWPLGLADRPARPVHRPVARPTHDRLDQAAQAPQSAYQEQAQARGHGTAAGSQRPPDPAPDRHRRRGLGAIVAAVLFVRTGTAPARCRARRHRHRVGGHAAADPDGDRARGLQASRPRPASPPPCPRLEADRVRRRRHVHRPQGLGHDDPWSRR